MDEVVFPISPVGVLQPLIGNVAMSLSDAEFFHGPTEKRPKNYFHIDLDATRFCRHSIVHIQTKHKSAVARRPILT